MVAKMWGQKLAEYLDFGKKFVIKKKSDSFLTMHSSTLGVIPYAEFMFSYAT